MVNLPNLMFIQEKVKIISISLCKVVQMTMSFVFIVIE